MDFAFTEQQEMIRKAEYPVEFIEAFARNGWLGIIVPEEYGGSGLGLPKSY